MLAERSPDEQCDVGPTLASTVGPAKLTTLSQRWSNVVMLSGVSNHRPLEQQATAYSKEGDKNDKNNFGGSKLFLSDLTHTVIEGS